MTKINQQPTICLDFDGVIHSYKSGWVAADIVADAPVPGAREAVAAIRARGFRVVMQSVRATFEDGGREAIEWWLLQHGIVVDERAGGNATAVPLRRLRARPARRGVDVCCRMFGDTVEDHIKRFAPA